MTFCLLRPMADFRDCGHEDYFQVAGGGWYLVVTDVFGSTKPAADGCSRQVNNAEADTLVAIMQALDKRLVFFVFVASKGRRGRSDGD